MERTQAQKAAIAIVMAMAEAIEQLGEVPSGHLYARLMDKMSIGEYNRIIDILKELGWVSESNHLLKWVKR